MNTNQQKAYLDTLAQSRTENHRKSPVILVGKGSDLKNKDLIKNKAKRKVITQSFIPKLIDLAISEGNQKFEKMLWNSYHCLDTVHTYEGKLHGTYCKNRVCSLCNSNRKAIMINKYLPELLKWEDPHFVTLTIKAVSKKRLQSIIDQMVRAFREIKDTQRKRYSRGKGIKLVGIKSLECNFNPVARTYNPHFHLIVPDRATAALLRDEWIKKWSWAKNEEQNEHGIWRTRWVNKSAQHLKRINSLEHALVETIKYGSKIFTEPNPKKKKNKKTPPQIYIQALYNVLKAFDGHRLFDRFGFNTSQTDTEEEHVTLAHNYTEWMYSPSHKDWHEPIKNEVLSHYVLPQELEHLLEKNINTTHE